MNTSKQLDESQKELILKILTITTFLALTMFAISISFFIFFQKYALITVKGDSMEPTFTNGESILLEKTKNIEKNTIVVFQKPQDWPLGENSNSNDLYLIKRVQATENDELVLKKRTLYINDQQIYKMPVGYKCENPEYEGIVPENSFFAMGDNHERSLDSLRLLCDNELGKMYIDEKTVTIVGINEES